MRQVTEFLFFICYPVFLFSTEELGPSPRGSDRLRSGSLQADMNVIV